LRGCTRHPAALSQPIQGLQPALPREGAAVSGRQDQRLVYPARGPYRPPDQRGSLGGRCALLALPADDLTTAELDDPVAVATQPLDRSGYPTAIPAPERTGCFRAQPWRCPGRRRGTTTAPLALLISRPPQQALAAPLRRNGDPCSSQPRHAVARRHALIPRFIADRPHRSVCRGAEPVGWRRMRRGVTLATLASCQTQRLLPKARGLVPRPGLPPGKRRCPSATPPSPPGPPPQTGYSKIARLRPPPDRRQLAPATPGPPLPAQLGVGVFFSCLRQMP